MDSISRNVVSWCDIPEGIRDNHWMDDYPTGCYVEIEITSRKEQEQYDDDFTLVNWVIDNYPKAEGKYIFVHIDY